MNLIRYIDEPVVVFGMQSERNIPEDIQNVTIVQLPNDTW